MTKDIINRVAISKLIVIDLEDYYLEGRREVFDIKDWLYEGIVLREKDFRAHVKSHDWSNYSNAFVALTCSSEAIIPAWAYMLLTVELAPYAKKVVIGNLNNLELSLYQDIISKMDIEPYRDKPIIIKGCTNKPVPENAYVLLAAKLQPVCKSIMYGEACSSVPLYKKPRQN